MRLLFCFAGLISLVVGSFTGCAGYINIPEKNIVSLKDIKVQLFADGSSKPVAETEVAPKSGFFHVSYDKLGKGMLMAIMVETCFNTGIDKA